MFQSTRPRGARRDTDGRFFKMFHCFNPRARVGRDQSRTDLPLHTSLVSIHAPAWGATQLHPSFPYESSCFNPRARVGRDSERLAILSIKDCFNPRARVGRDAWEWAAVALWCLFQSTRPRGARRGGVRNVAYGGGVSIHAPAWGATLAEAQHKIAELVSIHAPAWGATHTP